jgi:hypothetical protein
MRVWFAGDIMKCWNLAIAGTLAVGMSAALPAVAVLTQAPAPRFIFLDIRGGRVVSTLPDGSDVRVLVSGRSGTPDGVADGSTPPIWVGTCGAPRWTDRIGNSCSADKAP